jgi:phosphatidylethanolamine-binding protein (PEBP) family uncharacterized protein
MYDINSTIGTLLHWTIVNITDANINTGRLLASYLGPLPPPGSGIHNYVFYLYEQTSEYDGPEIIDPNNIFTRVIPLETLLNDLNINSNSLLQITYFISYFV